MKRRKFISKLGFIPTILGFLGIAKVKPKLPIIKTKPTKSMLPYLQAQGRLQRLGFHHPPFIGRWDYIMINKDGTTEFHDVKTTSKDYSSLKHNNNV